MTPKKTIRRCFISAGYATQIKELQLVLDQLGVVWQWAQSSASDPSILASVVSGIKAADFLLAVLQQGESSANVLVEVGIAVGLGKPILLLKTGDATIPSELAGLASFASDLNDPKLLEFQIDLFVRSMEGRSTSKRTVKSISGAKRIVQDIPSPELFGSALEQTVAAAITRHGGRVTIPSRSKTERTPDLLMWMPQLSSELFNPAAIEVVGSSTIPDLKKLQTQFADFLQSSGLRCGLILVNSVSREKELRKLTPIPWIFGLTLHEFKQHLELGDLGQWARHERNRLAHGVR